MRNRILMSISVLTLLLAVSAFGQSTSISANIPFAFTIGAKMHAAGQYTFTEVSNGQNFTVRNSSQGAVAILPIVTRTAAAMHTTPADSHLVFDKVGESYCLSEVWIPGLDGFVVHITKGKHEHRVLDVPR